MKWVMLLFQGNKKFLRYMKLVVLWLINLLLLKFYICKNAYYEALDLITNCVRSWFDQPGYNTYKNLQELLFKAIKWDNFESELQYVSQFYQDDINSANLHIQLQILTHDYPTEESTSIFDIRNYMKGLSPAKKQLMVEVCTVLKLILVMPASNATSERPFSALWRV